MLWVEWRKENAMQNMEADSKPIDPFAFFEGFFRGQFPDVDDAAWVALCREAWDEMSQADREICAELASIFYGR